MTLILVMFFIGLLLGFVGASGAGFIIAILTSLFGIPVHMALGTALVSILFATLSGAAGHYRQGNVHMKTGIVIGLTGAVGSYGGSQVARLIPGDVLILFTVVMLLLASFLMWYRTRMNHRPAQTVDGSRHPIAALSGVGILTGFLFGVFGIGLSPLIQLGLLSLIGLPLRQAAGTTLLTMIPIAFFGSLGYWQAGYLDFWLLLQVNGGMMSGSYIGSKFTNRVSNQILRGVMVSIPAMAAIIMVTFLFL
ncbi:sulfite exporter TauE/SafE family protein [Desmospora profundinema]|uniref:Probable membrane transporter protein n=1 Tax=Desmospora profundinema TaxID=1571184 RepID=A0ABU1IML5_9BACL|nr:sulfite exporter TauE/SafE family protein [Desmospora profundinema]MDR6225983.1 putative membrane protein YfcA [Desmospora profundinema]